MKKVHIYAYGTIENEQSAFAADFGVVSMKMFADVLFANPNAEEIVVHIHSQGGDVDEGFGIHDMLINSGKKVTTIIEGNCASIATIVALAGSERKATANSNFLIHNAWGMSVGEAHELHRQADEVKKAEVKMLDFYVAKTGGDKEKIKAMMDVETKMTAEEAKALGFITEVLTPVKAFTKIKLSNPNENQIINTMKKEFVTLFAELRTSLGLKPQANAGGEEDDKGAQANAAVSVVTDKGTLEVAAPKLEGAISIDDVCTIEGIPAEAGEYTVEGVAKYTIAEGGVVSSVEELKKEESEEEKAEAAKALIVAELKTKNESLVAEIAAMKIEKEKSDAAVLAQIADIKSQIGSNYTPPAGTQTFGKGGKGGDEKTTKEKMKERAEGYKGNKPANA